MNPWAVNPAWQNFSSLYREATTAQETKTDMERFHHLTASLYFGIAALEAFLNQKMRAHLKATNSEDIVHAPKCNPILSPGAEVRAIWGKCGVARKRRKSLTELHLMAADRRG